MIGMDRLAGKRLSGDAHLAQSIGTILSTPIGTRVMRRDFGSLLFELIDQPFNAMTRLRMFAATAVALARWEPRIRLTRVTVEQGSEPRQVIATIEGTRTDGAAPNSFARLTIPLSFAAA
jgi:uncharacterized protein